MVDRGEAAEGRLLATDFPGPDDAAYLLAFNARGTRLAVSCDHRMADRVLVFDPRSGREVARLEHLPFVSSLAFISAEVLLIAQQNHYQGEKRRPGRCVRCDLRQGSREIVLEQESLSEVAVSPNGRIAAVQHSAGLGKNDGLALYETARWQVRRHLTTLFGYGGAWHTVFSGGGRFVAASLYGSSGGYLIAVWDARDGRRQRTFEAAQCARVFAFRDDTLTLVVGGSHAELLRYEEDKGEDPAAAYPLEDLATAVQFRDRTLTVLLDNGSVCFLRADTGRVQKRVPPPAGQVLRYAVASADWSLVAAAVAGGVLVWTGT